MSWGRRPQHGPHAPAQAGAPGLPRRGRRQCPRAAAALALLTAEGLGERPRLLLFHLKVKLTSTLTHAREFARTRQR